MTSLADFLETLVERDELVRVAAEVDPALEAAEIARRVARDGGPALLFENLRGAAQAAVANLFGTEGRVCQALGVERLDEAAARVEALIQQSVPHTWFDRLKLAGEQPAIDRFRAKRVRQGACQQVVRLGRDVDLEILPGLQAWPEETGRAVTGARLVFLAGDGTTRVVEPCRLQVVDHQRAAVVADAHGEFSRQWREARQREMALPVAVVLGGDPAAIAAATVPLPPGVDGYLYAGLLCGTAIEVVTSRTSPLEVPADAEIVLEGHLDPIIPPAAVRAAALGGAYYAPAIEAPMLHVQALTQRSNPVVPIVIDAGHVGDVAVLDRFRQRMLLPLVKAVIPELVDWAMPTLGGVGRYAFLAIRKTSACQARRVASAFWGITSLMHTKWLIVVDEQVNVQDTAAVLARAGANVDPARDLFFWEGPLDATDPALVGPTAKRVAIDATDKIAGEHPRDWPARLETTSALRELVDGRWAEYGLPEEWPLVLAAARRGG